MPESAHYTTSPNCQYLCDALLAGIEKSAGQASRREVKRWCVLRVDDRTVGWAHHVKTKSELDVYFPSTPTDSFSSDGAVHPSRRLSLASPWAQASSWHFRLKDEGEVVDAVRLLVDASNKHAMRKSAMRTRSAIPEELPADEAMIEGASQRVTVNRYERDSRARRACIRIHGTTCAACGFAFAARYGKQFEGLITVHHLKPLSEIQESYRVDPERDLRPVCPNCHFIIHQRPKPYSIEEVREMLRTKYDAG